MITNSRWGLIIDVFEAGENAYEVKIAFADPLWTPELEFGKNIEGWVGQKGSLHVSLSPANPYFASYEESAEERSRRLATSLLDVIGDRRFYILKTLASLATPPCPIAIDRKMQFCTRKVIATIPPTKLIQVDVFRKAIAQVTSLCENGRAAASQTLLEVAETKLLSDMKTIPVCWGAGRGFLIHQGGTSGMIIFPVGTPLPDPSVAVAGTEQQVKVEMAGSMT